MVSQLFTNVNNQLHVAFKIRVGSLCQLHFHRLILILFYWSKFDLQAKPLPSAAGSDTKKWHTVGIIKALTHTVSSYIPYDEWNRSMLDDPNIKADCLPDLSRYHRVALEPGTAYRFRLSAINGCGLGEYGEVSRPLTTLLLPDPTHSRRLAILITTMLSLFTNFIHPPSS